MNNQDTANPDKEQNINLKADKPIESFNYLNLQDSMVTQNTTFYEDNESKNDSKETGQRRISNGIVKIVHQISKYENEDDSNDDSTSTDMTSQILAEEIFCPIVW